MVLSALSLFKSNLEVIGLIGLLLDAGGALLVLGPEIPTVARLATYVERRRMSQRLEKLIEEGELHEGVELLDRLYQEMKTAPNPGFGVQELEIRDDRVIFGNEGLDNGQRISRTIDDFRKWIDDYPGIDREYYLAGGGLLLLGFLFQIVAQSATINVWFGVFSLIITFCVAMYLFYRAVQHLFWGVPFR